MKPCLDTLGDLKLASLQVNKINTFWDIMQAMEISLAFTSSYAIIPPL